MVTRLQVLMASFFFFFFCQKCWEVLKADISAVFKEFHSCGKFERSFISLFQALAFDFLQIRDFHIAEREEDIGYYAGYVGEHNFYASIFMVFFFLGILFEALSSYYTSHPLKDLHLCLEEL